MQKIITLMMTFMGAVYGMDEGPLAQEQGQPQLTLRLLHQDLFTLFSQTPGELFPIIESYRAAKVRALQEQLSRCQSMKEIRNFCMADDHCKSAPLSLHLGIINYNSAIKETDLKECTQLFPNLMTLDLRHIQGMTEAWLEHLKGFLNLKTLGLDSVNLDDAWLERLQGVPSLTTLDLSYTSITPAGLQHLKGLPNLRAVSFYGTAIQDAWLDHFKEFPNLTFLKLSNTLVTHAGVHNLKRALPECEIIS